ncbi:MAG TPA: SRPBCC family protein [Saprospiraceae bacterium]|nr:SRPBCC family protein [Saprospiraceae bacterium]
MKVLKRTQWLPVTLDDAWEFFSSPANLNDITPKDMVFEILSEVPKVMYEGLFIMYRIKPIFNIPMQWVTEITHIKDRTYFIDEQRSGPYRLWHHEHHFEEKDGGVLMKDLLYYDVGMGWVGQWASFFFIDRKVKEIFDYRFQILEEKFGKISV